MKLYNTLTKTIDEFTTHEDGVVKMYTCGPTVYHFAHIGNLRTYMMEDVLEKYLRFIGYDVKRTMNITDVGHLTSDADTGEDKMVKGAKREHKTVMEIAKQYTDAFFKDCDDLNIRKPDIIVPATSYVGKFIKVIKSLQEKGYAYVSGGNVYFDTSKSENYGQLAGLSDNKEDLKVGVRSDVDEDLNKKNKNDFVLWFTKSKFEDQELKWNSPWGTGYPGWHIECSCISMENLGEYLDLHCGGVDNIFPHHTNEIAQSEAYIGHKWCTQWFHVQHLNDQSGKMSKSKGEFLTVSLLKEKGYNPLAYRFFCLQSHYRKPLTFTYDSLDNCALAYNKLYAKVASLGTEGEVDKDRLASFRKAFTDAMDFDLNTAQGITVLYDVLKSDANDVTKREAINEIDSVFSLGLRDAKPEVKREVDEARIESLIAERAEAKKNKNYARADEIRNSLAEEGIILVDTPQGTTYKVQ